jgi:hypothetical protein
VVIIYNRKMPGDVIEGGTKGKTTQRREAREAKLAKNATDEEGVAPGGVDQESWNNERTHIRALNSHSFDKTMLGMNARYVLSADAKFAEHGCVTDGDLAAPTTLREQTGNSRSHGLCYIHRIRTMYKNVSDMKSAMRKHRNPDEGPIGSAGDNKNNDGLSPIGAPPPHVSRVDAQS